MKLIFRKRVFLGILLTFCSIVYSQAPSFMFPIKPQKVFLTGTMGELRGNHFHAGLDIRTDYKEGLPIFASEAGHVTRIVVKTAGYGLALYLKHPSGHLTVYGHLQKFEPKIWDFILSKQIECECFELDLNLNPGDFEFNKGDVIGYSGNSGSSGGPHLHFEIRDAEGNYLNPLDFLPKMVEDNVPPIINKIALRTMDRNSRINGEFGRFEFAVKNTKNGYVIDQKIEAVGSIGFEVVTYDLMNGPKNLQGVNFLTLKQNFETVYQFSLQKYSHPETYCINAHVDYATLKTKGNWFQKCYLADGNEIQSIKAREKGYLTIDSTKTNVFFTAADAFGNSSSLFFNIFPATESKAAPKIEKLKGKQVGVFSYQLFENILKLEYKDNPPNVGILAEVYRKGQSYTLAPSYAINNTTVYLWDMRVTIPDSIVVCDKRIVFPFSKTIPSEVPYSFHNENCRIVFGKKTLFDTLFLKYSLNNGFHQVHDIFTPLREEIILTLKYDTINTQKEKTAIYHYSSPKSFKYIGGNWEATDIVFKSKFLGGFGLLEDSKKPVVKPLKINAKEISLTVSDFPSGIKDFKCYLDSTFVPLHYDFKRKLVWAEKKDKTIPFKGSLKIVVRDQMNNEEIIERKLK